MVLPKQNTLTALPCLLAILLSASTLSCRREQKVGIDSEATQARPTMVSHNVETLISDSGITRFRITTPLWIVYDDNTPDPCWVFPQGLNVEKYDPQFKPEATITADSAKYFKNKQLWRLDGNVDISNTAGEKFLTPQLYWDQRSRKVYSDSFIHIERADRIVEGIGFESNEQMTRYSIRSVQASLPSSSIQQTRQQTTTDTI